MRLTVNARKKHKLSYDSKFESRIRFVRTCVVHWRRGDLKTMLSKLFYKKDDCTKEYKIGEELGR